MSTPDLRRGMATQNAGYTQLLTRYHYIRRGHGGCDKVCAKGTSFAGLSRTSYRSDPYKNAILFELLDGSSRTLNGSVGQLYRLNTSLGQRCNPSQKLLSGEHRDINYNTSHPKGLC